ncbi:hypothetical protein G5714_013311 [Onychostoma macrolepis]|uniref:Uncharacterized protein n=1 Tax=Onychostoma macrolepis TaxID=369639 RepID=A0A7J6CEB3_9TELE|nr:hypothetical protein G5714_013311 [Onychostoma macrolepis]
MRHRPQRSHFLRGAKEQRAETTHFCTSALTQSHGNGLTGEAAEAEDTPEEANSLLKANKTGRRQEE